MKWFGFVLLLLPAMSKKIGNSCHTYEWMDQAFHQGTTA
jgi:hypothetical protein